MNEEKREQIALFRYSLIVPFLSQEELEWGVKGELLKRMVQQIHSIPFSEKSSLNESTIRNYLRLYRDKGFDGLKPKTRSDNRKSRKIAPDILEQAIILKKEEPRRAVSKIIQILEAHQMVEPGLLKKSTLARIFKQQGMTRKQLTKINKTFRSFQAEHPNQIWQSDILHGPYLPDPDRPKSKKRTYLVAVIDDFSRLVPHAEFHLYENLPCLENTLFKSILKKGIPEVFYVDNGQVYSAHQINTICAELGIRKISCRPYSPEGKGKIERLFRTVRDNFLIELNHEPVDNIMALNRKFWAWLEMEYHQKIHTATNDTPLNRWRQNIGKLLRTIDEKQLQSIFLWRKYRKVNKVGLISLEGLEFEVASFLVNKKVEVRYNPFDLDVVYIYLDDRFIQKAYQSTISRWNTAKKQSQKVTSNGETTSSHIKHLHHLEKQHQQQQVQHASQLLGQQQNDHQQQLLTQEEFIKHVAQALQRKIEHIHVKELKEMKLTYDKFGPFDPAIVTIALAKAQLDKGRTQHISFYMNYIIKHQLKENEK